ncbi:FG-GAP-like repeat-containing protein [Colwellia sp. E2M01]|uniref:FG-GAP-like repeat-containing protein n=1 Tax=Colwellia sp. E2M01 TaxID=2841561 RepID=UPI001C091374|nr:FG-GAP-like repeat-containing protein [Colwellia sp. E2M01]MBU2872090.1 VCBS repeat-containing protein [Colwellia sp. E2M01]
MLFNLQNIIKRKVITLFIIILPLSGCFDSAIISSETLIEPSKPLTIDYTIKDSLLKRVKITLYNPKSYANISLLADDKLLLDNLNIAKQGYQEINALVKFNALGETDLTLITTNADVIINELTLEDVEDLSIPIYEDISVKAGIDKVSSIKYGGPTIADIDNDGDYDFIVNNHNIESSKLYWNNGNGTVTKHDKDLSRWFMHDLHGTAMGDYDNDGDLDLVLTMGGGNGTNPSKALFYKNVNGKLVLNTGDVNIDKGGRGRGAKWTDMDLDGDLDLMLINESSLIHAKPQHFFYKNLGDGTFKYTPIEGLQDQEPSRALITDINNDNIDDVILYSPLTIWQGNGDFTFTNITNQLPADVAKMNNVMALTDIDIDNDGDFDLYLARGKVFEHGKGEAPSVDHDPISKEFSIKPRGYRGVNEFEFVTGGENHNGAIKFHQYNYLTQGLFRGKDYPIFLGSHKTPFVLKPSEELNIEPDNAQGWPEDISANGVYFGYIGTNKDGTKRWKCALVRNGNIFWTFRFSLSGVNEVTLGFEPENRNIADVLLRNDNGKFVDISSTWNIPQGGNALGVTTGDFNNDSYQDLFVYRWGLIGKRISDVMLLNTGKGSFETVTMHGANDVGGPGNGDMGQAFDFDLDGDLDLLNGSEDGEWYLYSNNTSSLANSKTTKNQNNDLNNYALIKVGYAPESNVDAISAEVILKTATNTYRKRVGSAGAIFSQSLLNIVHFGLGSESDIESIQVKWRNGETVSIYNKQANQLFDTDKIDPKSINITPEITEIRQGESVPLYAELTPVNADPNIIWASSDESILSIDNNGILKAVGEKNKAATITATSPTNKLFSEQEINIVDWYEKPIQSIVISHSASNLIVGDVLQLNTNKLPNYADDEVLEWTSNNENIATVDAQGVVTLIAAGEVAIKVTAQSNPLISDQVLLTVLPLIKPFINIENEEAIKSKIFTVGDKITLNVNYHAGIGNTVISADQGGIRYWLREFKYKWIPAKDIVKTDTSALKTESGSSTMTFSLEGLTPTAELPKGHFYYLNVTFSASDGEEYKHEIYPITITERDQAK